MHTKEIGQCNDSYQKVDMVTSTQNSTKQLPFVIRSQ
jgi:hypothetical protein